MFAINRMGAALWYLNYSLLFCVSECAENSAGCQHYWETTPSLLSEGRKRCQRCWQVACGFCKAVWWGLYYRKWVAFWFSPAYFRWKKTLKLYSDLDVSFQPLILHTFFITFISSFLLLPLLRFSYRRTSETLSQASLKATAAFSNMGSAISKKLEDVR